jgi:hypothetical protein
MTDGAGGGPWFGVDIVGGQVDERATAAARPGRP